MAADANTLLALLNAGSTVTDPNDLLAFRQTVADNNIYRQAAQPLMQMRFNTSTWSPLETLGTSLAQSFLGGLLGSYAQDVEGRQLEIAANSLPGLAKDPLNFGTPEGVDPSAFSQLRMMTIAKNALKEKENELKREDDKTKLRMEIFSKRPDLMPESLRAELGITGLDPATRPGATAPIGGGLLANGQVSTAQKIADYNKEFLAQGLPPTQAAAAARQQVDAEIKANGASFDEARAAREHGQKLIDLASTARQGIAKAGETGNFQGLRSGLDVIGSLFSDSSKEKLVGDNILESIEPEIVKMSRSPGAVSDYESRMYLKSGPSTRNTPEANRILADKMEQMGKLHMEHADFLEAYRNANAGSIAGASKKWSEYRAAVPLFKESSTGIEINNERPSWAEFFAGQGGSPETSIAQEVAKEKLGIKEQEPVASSAPRSTKASELIARGYTRGPNGWIPPRRNSGGAVRG